MYLSALLSHGVEDTRLDPTVPPFLSENVADLPAEEFGIQPIDTIRFDEEAMFNAM